MVRGGLGLPRLRDQACTHPMSEWWKCPREKTPVGTLCKRPRSTARRFRLMGQKTGPGGLEWSSRRGYGFMSRKRQARSIQSVQAWPVTSIRSYSLVMHVYVATTEHTLGHVFRRWRTFSVSTTPSQSSWSLSPTPYCFGPSSPLRPCCVQPWTISAATFSAIVLPGVLATVASTAPASVATMLSPSAL